MYVSMFIFIFVMAGQTAGPITLKFSELTHQIQRSMLLQTGDFTSFVYAILCLF